MAKKRSLAQWQALIEQQQLSGLNIARFCQQHGLAKSIFINIKKSYNALLLWQATVG